MKVSRRRWHRIIVYSTPVIIKMKTRHTVRAIACICFLFLSINKSIKKTSLRHLLLNGLFYRRQLHAIEIDGTIAAKYMPLHQEMMAPARYKIK